MGFYISGQISGYHLNAPLILLLIHHILKNKKEKNLKKFFT